VRYEDLTHAQRDLYYDTLFTSHVMQVVVYHYDRNEQFLGELDPDSYAIVSGQVDVDTTQPVPKQLLMDVQPRTASFVSDIANGPFHPAKFIAVDYWVYVPQIAGGTWVETRVFYGPTTMVQFDETNYVLHVEAQSKESLYLPPNIANNTQNLGGKSKDTKPTLHNLILHLATDMGETRFRLSRAAGKVTFNRTRYDAFARANGAWPYMVNEARRRGFKLWFDRRGNLTLRKMVHQPVVSFTTSNVVDKQGNVAQPPNVASVPQVQFSVTTDGTGGLYYNAVQVYGKLKAKGKVKLLGAAYEPPAALFDSESMARHGHKRLMLLTITTDNVMKRAAAIAQARSSLKDAQLSAQQSSFDCLPVPHLDINDVVALRGDLTAPDGGGTKSFIPQQWTLPLVPSELMSIGYNRPVRVLSKTRGRVRSHR